MTKYKVPSQAASGADTFSDDLVGNQITNGVNQMTGTNFAVDKAIPEKDSKEFITQPFSEFVTLETINQEGGTTADGTSDTVDDTKIKFNNDKNNADRSLYGSLKQRIGASIENIILKYPAAILVDTQSPVSVNNYSAESSVFDINSNTTEFMVQSSLLYNPLDIVLVEPKSNTISSTDNEIRNFFSSYTKYIIDFSGVTYNILSYTEPNSDNRITLKVNGDCFNGATGFTENYIIRPNNGVVEEFYKTLDDLETVLLNRESSPIFNAGFNVPKEIDTEPGTEIVTEYINWPVSRDGWNIQVIGISYDYYLEKISSIAEQIDEFKSNLFVRFLTSPQLFEFDTDGHKAEAIFQVYGQSFDQIKLFIDNIAYMRNVSYDGINNLPNILLKNLCETLGLSSVSLFDEKTLEEALYTRHDVRYDGVSTGTNLIEAEYTFYRRLLVNLIHLYKSKGTRNAIEFFLKFIGAPEPMIRLDEYVYKIDELLPSQNVESDINDAIQGVKIFNIATYNTGVTGTTGYTLTQISGSTSLSRDGYPVDEITGLPRKIVSSTGDIYFEQGAGWYKKTLEHRSQDILDTTNSDLTGRTKIIKSMSKPFTYGEEYFDFYRHLPGLDYGYTLSSKTDNKKAEIIEDENQSKLTLNRKNINVFLSSDRGIDYDIYRRSRDNSLSFYSLTPQTGITFAEFLDTIVSEIITNSHIIKYKNTYNDLLKVYNAYEQTTSGFTPYNYITVNDFINRLSPYWINIVEQFIPATTLWVGGNAIENGIFNRSKYKHAHPATPRLYTEILYPDFETVIREDLETIIGGGTIGGGDTSFRGTHLFSGLTFSISLEINGVVYSGETSNLKPFSSYAPPITGTTILSATSNSIPLVCGYDSPYNTWSIFNGGTTVEDMKVIWKNTLTGITETINQYTGETGQEILVEFFTDINGIEKVRFTIIPNDYYGYTGNETFDYYFEPLFKISKYSCILDVDVLGLTGITTSDIYFNITGATGDEIGRYPIYIHTGDSENISAEYISGGLYVIRNIGVSTITDITFTDAGNCEKRRIIDGLSVAPGQTFNYGIKKGTIVYKEISSPTPPSDYTELQDAILLGTITESTIEDVQSGDSLLSISLHPYSGLTSGQFKNGFIDGFQFAFDYGYINIVDKASFSSVKTVMINNEFEILPTSMILVYSNMSVGLEEIDHHFEYKYPEDLYIKPTGSTQNGDYLINQFGFPIEITAVTLNYCSIDKIYYQINRYGSSEVNKYILFNGKAGNDNRIISSFASETFIAPPPSPSPSRTPSPTPTITPTITPTKTLTPTVTPTITPTVTISPTMSPTLTPTLTPTITPSITITPSLTPSITPSLSITPTLTPTIPSDSISLNPSFVTFTAAVIEIKSTQVTSSGDWTASLILDVYSIVDDYTTTGTSGDNCNVTNTVNNDRFDECQSATIRFTCGTATTDLTVYQDGHVTTCT